MPGDTHTSFQAKKQRYVIKCSKETGFRGRCFILTETGKTIRNDIHKHDSFKFAGLLASGCQVKSLPISLKYLVGIITKGPNFKGQEKCDSQACLTIGQIIKHNTKETSPSAMGSRHTLERAPPLFIYIAMNAHTPTRNKKVIHQ